jgi:hypothetical protein
MSSGERVRTVLRARATGGLVGTIVDIGDSGLTGDPVVALSGRLLRGHATEVDTTQPQRPPAGMRVCPCGAPSTSMSGRTPRRSTRRPRSLPGRLLAHSIVCRG